MDFQRGTLDILFHQLSPCLVLDNIFGMNKKNPTILYNEIGFNVFYNCAMQELGRYGEDELEHVHTLTSNRIKENYGVFGLLADYTEKVLVMDRDEPKCRFEEAIRWREISYNIGQDILTTAYVAKRDVDTRYNSQFFAWPATIKTDNYALQHVLNKGFAENHYHLYGSTQVFPLNWACLMNHIQRREKEFKNFEPFLQQHITFDSRHSSEFSYHHLCIQAATIRASLFAKFCTPDADSALETSQQLGQFLFSVDSVLGMTELQHFIGYLVFEYGNKIGRGVLDYALTKQMHVSNFNSDRMLAGERYFLYRCFRAVFDGSMDDYSKNILYVYLLIKAKFRGELVQINNRVGFRNFSDYQGRKSCFIDDYSDYVHESERLAILSPFDSQHLTSMEVRLAPKSTPVESLNRYYGIQHYIKTDQTIEYVQLPLFPLFPDRAEQEGKQREFHEKYNVRYVIHFIKLPDEKLKGIKDHVALSMQYRHYSLRQTVKNQALALTDALSQDQKYRTDIVGIDACNNEIGCRPEVFAQTYRYLCDYRPVTRFYDTPEKFKMNATYHAGEDFLDLADGLRAIDEAILFCGLTRDSRIGHALALGTDSREYYKGKHGAVVMSKQDWIDNIAWIHGKSIDLGIDLKPAFRGWCLNQFAQYFSNVYKYDGAESANIISYYSSWKLRGDSPELYKGAHYRFPVIHSPYDDFAKNEPSAEKELFDVWRNDRTIYELCQHYHYDGEAKNLGSENGTFDITDGYIETIDKIQKKLMLQICEKGICIECNPSSNLVIGTFRRYDKHPIFAFYNNGLCDSSADRQVSPQLSVSVNTDDQGVFDTLLQNEYELLACSLFSQKDGDGHQVFAPESIYKWIDDVREMGIRQTFE